MSTSADRIKHLEFIQATIARQATHAFSVKGWSLTVAGAIYAYTASHLTWWMAIVALLPPVAFAWLDAFYLRQERLFRELYRDAIRSGTTVAVFDMDTRKYQHHQQFPNCTYRAVTHANTWRVLHGAIVGVGLLLFGIAVVQRLRATELADCVRNAF